MKLERFRSFDGLEIRALDKKDARLFEHCAGGVSISSKYEKELYEMLFIHSVGIIVQSDHSSVHNKQG